MRAVWTMKNGQEIAIKDMGDSHLLNTIRLVRRYYGREMLANALAADSYAVDAPDGASMAAQSEANYAFEEADEQEDIGRHIPVFRCLLAELKRRKLEELDLE